MNNKNIINKKRNMKIMLAPKIKYNSCNCNKLDENEILSSFKFSKPQENGSLVVSFYKKPIKSKNKSLF